MPKDKWAQAKRLKQLQKEFPHDRVIERMIEEEMKSNPKFRYPLEYDVFHEEAEEKFRMTRGGKVKAADDDVGEKG